MFQWILEQLLLCQNYSKICSYFPSILNQIDKQVFIWKQILQHGKKHSSIKLLLKNTAIKFLLKITLLPHFMDVIQLFQGYRATTRRQFTYH